jgi:(1->4)-alpha-D-glucan 1-alpha-D-glucosylmutase
MNIPRATYRLQIRPEFPFSAVRSVLAYLRDLGVSHVYASPVFQPRHGSSHGYDVVDPNRVNAELGSEQELQETIRMARSHGIGWIQDIVPNHMAFEATNSMLMNIFEIGASSPFHRVFDIDWNHPFANLHGRVLAPFLGKFYGQCLEDGELRLIYDNGTFFVTYFSLRFPLLISSYSRVLGHRLETLQTQLGKENSIFTSFLGTLFFFQNIDLTQRSKVLFDQVEHGKEALRRLINGNPVIASFLDENLAHFNGTPGNPPGFDDLDKLMTEQMFRLAFWKVADEEINYRRFFNINELISVRVEDPEILNMTHALIGKLLSEEHIDGVRIDHIDGLFDPEGYLGELRRISPEACIFVEKVLEGDEELPPAWSCQGTTGYDALNVINQLFCRRDSEKAFDKIQQRVFPTTISPEELLSDNQRMIVGHHLAGNIHNLALYVKNFAGNNRYGKDLTLGSLQRALIEFLTFFPVYRSYIRDKSVSTHDRRRILEAVERSLARSPDLRCELEFLRRFFLFEFDDAQNGKVTEDWLKLVMNLQQYTGPLKAKGVEDTFFYVYNRLTALNEVGGNPLHFGISLEDAHTFFEKRRKRCPDTMNCSATHDTKRGEDARARLLVLSELPLEWSRLLKEWQRLNRPAKTTVQGRYAPNDNDEYLIYQTLLGTFPFAGDNSGDYPQRVKQYIQKAVREAKIHSNWVNPCEAYENACFHFLDTLLDPVQCREFRRSFDPFQQKIAFYGVLNSLAQTTLKLTVPGFPDVYQGTEFWDFSLVDPDNRRPVDFPARIAALASLRQVPDEELPATLRRLLEHPEDGHVKQALLFRLLTCRHRLPELFRHGSYEPVQVTGVFRDQVIAFRRRWEDQELLVVVPRFPSLRTQPGEYPLGQEYWRETRLELPDPGIGDFRDAISGRNMAIPANPLVGEWLTDFPVVMPVKGLS